jgi:carbamoyl-phosphate synthase small subunit
VLVHAPDGRLDVASMIDEARAWPGLEGMDLALEVTTRQLYKWDETRWELGKGYGKQTAPRFKVVAVDYGAKRNILRCLASAGCDVTVVPATASAEDILRHHPDGVFLSNGRAIPPRPANTRCPRSAA